MNPRPYSRMYQLTGTNGYANKYPIEEYCFRPDQIKGDDIPNHENLNMHAAVSEEVKATLMKKYKHPIHQELEETAKKVGGHGGMDYIMGLPSGVLPAQRFAVGYGCVRLGRMVLHG